MKHPEYSHRPLSSVFQAVLDERRQVHGRPPADHPLLLAEVEDSLSIDYIDDLVVRMAVRRCAARRDDPDELRHVRAADVLVYEIPELAVGSCLERRLVGVPDGPAG